MNYGPIRKLVDAPRRLERAYEMAMWPADNAEMERAASRLETLSRQTADAARTLRRALTASEASPRESPTDPATQQKSASHQKPEERVGKADSSPPDP